ncbi:MAG: SH3 domain-containing protein [Phenylobacterium sp.]|uniref:SH3 domain-containing protein n=1 Tax=Phenylobacterium sp. TaxID=1871053 RepID=UPI0025D3A2C7|nr:SH3 domain-containing protein [Phenylobacterium sp.]MBI1196768.1 SH3 domain-containing protein [Phenylobacterium sp.]
MLTFPNAIMRRVLLASVMAGTLAVGAGSTATAGVTSCSASGGKQEAGAAIGAVVGGLLGNAVGGRHATGETVVGAAAGAAAGSAIGCEAQKSDAAKRGAYSHNGYRLNGNLSPARYDRIGETFVAVSGVNLRAAPTTRSARVGRLQARERFQALAQVQGTDWILVGERGVGVGYVRADFVRPVDRRYAVH